MRPLIRPLTWRGAFVCWFSLLVVDMILTSLCSRENRPAAGTTAPTGVWLLTEELYVTHGVTLQVRALRPKHICVPRYRTAVLRPVCAPTDFADIAAFRCCPIFRTVPAAQNVCKQPVARVCYEL